MTDEISRLLYLTIVRIPIKVERASRFDRPHFPRTTPFARLKSTHHLQYPFYCFTTAFPHASLLNRQPAESRRVATVSKRIGWPEGAPVAP